MKMKIKITKQSCQWNVAWTFDGIRWTVTATDTFASALRIAESAEQEAK